MKNQVFKPGRIDILLMAIVFLVSFAFRFAFFRLTPFELRIDAFSMSNYAYNVMNGEYYGHCFGDYWARYAYWPPLYIFLSGFVYKFFGLENDFTVMRLIQVFVSSLSCIVAYLFARYCTYSFREKKSALSLIVSFAAGMMMAINQRMIVYTNHLYVETVFIFIMLLLFYWFMRYYRQEFLNSFNNNRNSNRNTNSNTNTNSNSITIGNYINNKKLIDKNSSFKHSFTKFSLFIFKRILPGKYLLLSGIFLGLGNLTRPVLLYMPFVFAVFLLLTQLGKKNFFSKFKAIVKDIIVLTVISFIVMSPWIIRNLTVMGRLVLVDTNGPINFVIAHNERATGEWNDIKPFFNLNELYDTGYKVGFDYIITHKKRVLFLALKKQILIIERGDDHIDKTKELLDRAKIPDISFTALFVALIGAFSIHFILLVFRITNTKKRKKALKSNKLKSNKLKDYKNKVGNLFSTCPGLLLSILGFTYFDLIIVAFYFAPRYRIVMEPLLILCLSLLAYSITKHINASRLHKRRVTVGRDK